MATVHETPGRGMVTGRARRLTRVSGLVAAAAVVGITGLAPTARADALPDGRVYELVSPTNTNGTNVTYGDAPPVVAPVGDDQVIIGGGLGPYSATDPLSGYNPYYLLQRTAGGWTDTDLLPASYSPYEEFTLQDATDDLSGMVFATGSTQNLSSGPPAAQAVPTSLVYRSQNGTFSTIVTDSLNPSDPSYGDPSKYGGMSADGQTVYYSSDVTPASLPSAGGLREVYEWHPDGIYAEVGTAATQRCGEEVAAQTDASIQTTTGMNGANNVSSDGQTVFFTNGTLQSPLPSGCPSATQVYVQRDGVVSDIAQPTDGTAAPTTLAPVLFEGATPDGSTAYFLTTEKLTADDTIAGSEQLYQWTAPSGGQSASVTCLTCELTGTNLLSNPMNIAVSRNGQYVYFFPGSSRQLFAAHDGSLIQVAPAPGSGATVNGVQGISADGNTVVWSDVMTQHGSTTDVLYRAVISQTTSSAPECVSCDPSGTLQDGVLGLNGSDPFGYALGSRGASTLEGVDAAGISADGDTVAFTSDDSLGTAAGERTVYEWTPSVGPVAVAPAGSDDASPDLDATISDDATNLFFLSSDQLVSGMTQSGTISLFDARVGGGFPGVTPTTPCSGDSCQGTASAAPTAPAVGSGVTTAGNVAPRVLAGSTARLRILRPSRRELATAARTGRLSLRVSVRGRGTLRATARARIGRRVRTIAHHSQGVRITGSRARIRAIPLRLAATARRDLARGQRLRVTVRVALSHGPTRTIRITLPGKAGR